jgi:UDP-glucose 4-epimerase
MTPTLVVGGGGLIGSAVVTALGTGPGMARPSTVVAPSGLPWTDPGALRARFRAEIESFATQVASSAEGRWRVVWAAGRAVVASSSSEADAETEAFRAFLGSIEESLDASAGRLLLVSSAGAMYAGSTGPPFDEASNPVPISAYGRSKQAQEWALGDFVSRTGATGIAARVANAYGARQDITKRQGLVSQLCVAIRTRRPVKIFVPLDTRRHLMWSADVGRAIANLLDTARIPDGKSEPRVVVSGRALTISETIGAIRRVVGTTPPHLLSRTKEAGVHPVDLRLRTNHEAEVGIDSPTPLEIGVERTWRASLREPRRR